MKAMTPKTYPLAWKETDSLYVTVSERTGYKYLCFWIDSRAVRIIVDTHGGNPDAKWYETLRDAKESAQIFDDWTGKK